MKARECRLEKRRLELADDMGVDPDDPAVWRALVIEEGTWTTTGPKDTAGRDNPGRRVRQPDTDTIDVVSDDPT